jgi:hypothetical protein
LDYRLDLVARDLLLQEILVREVHAAGGAVLSATSGENELLRCLRWQTSLDHI